MVNSNKLYFLGALCFTTALAIPNCPLLGADFPPSKNLSSSSIFQAALNNLTQVLSQSISSGNTAYGAFDGVNTSHSIEIFSAYDDDSPLFSNQFSAPALATPEYGVSNVTADTVFRIGSLTKLIAVYTFLIQAGDRKLNDPITDYIPELQAAALSLNATQDPIDYVSWEDVTVWEVASQMAGLGRDYSGLGELDAAIDPDSDPLSHGLPPLNASEIPPCAGLTFCTRAQFFAGFTQRHPVYAPSTNPTYSNVAFQLLGYVLENITGVDFATMVSDSIFDPLGLTGSSWTTPDSNSSGILPPGNNWGQSLGDDNPAGGMYSSSSDLTKIGRSILTSSLLSPAQTRRWMQPRSFTSSQSAAVGMPWEIFSVKTSPNDRLVFLYTKQGDINGYSSVFVIIKDWNIGFNVLTAGNAATSNSLLIANLISDTIFQAAEDAAREESQTNFVGTYQAADPNLNSSITVTMDASKPGLGVTRWISNGTDMLSPAVELVGVAAQSVRLYPSSLERDLGNGDMEVGFRGAFENLGFLETVGGSFGLHCATWVS